jgi:hypothetical protein
MPAKMKTKAARRALDIGEKSTTIGKTSPRVWVALKRYNGNRSRN